MYKTSNLEGAIAEEDHTRATYRVHLIMWSIIIQVNFI